MIVLYSRVTEEVVNETEKNLGDENPAGEEGAGDGNKETAANEAEEKEPEDKVKAFSFFFPSLTSVYLESLTLNLYLLSTEAYIIFEGRKGLTVPVRGFLFVFSP